VHSPLDKLLESASVARNNSDICFDVAQAANNGFRCLNILPPVFVSAYAERDPTKCPYARRWYLAKSSLDVSVQLPM
jgi:hypothetical protein